MVQNTPTGCGNDLPIGLRVSKNLHEPTAPVFKAMGHEPMDALTGTARPNAKRANPRGDMANPSGCDGKWFWGRGTELLLTLEPNLSQNGYGWTHMDSWWLIWCTWVLLGLTWPLDLDMNNIEYYRFPEKQRFLQNMGVGRVWYGAKYSHGVWEQFAHHSENFPQKWKMKT